MSRIIEPWRGKTLLKTIHGSKLYGLGHEGSDDDYYVVTEYGPAKQKISTTDGVTTDIFVIGLDEFSKKILKGTHQAVEALFSRVAELDPAWSDYFKSWRVYSPLVEETYDRTIRHLAVEDDFKKRRHAVRISINLISLRTTGRFNPRMSKNEKETANSLATSSENLLQDLRELLKYNRVPTERTNG